MFGAKARSLAVSFGALLLVGCAAPAPVSHDLTQADLDAVRASFNAVLEAEGRADWDGLAEFLTDDVVHLDPRLGVIRGKDEWRRWVDAMEFEITEPSVYRIEEVAGSGDMAYVLWTFTGSWIEGGNPVTARGKGLTVMIRGADGAWKEARNAWNNTPEEQAGG